MKADCVLASEAAPARSFVKSVGGKARLVPTLLEWLPTSFRNYHEPFVGGGALYWALASGGYLNGKVARLSDFNAELICAYQVVQDNVEGLIRRLSSMPNEHEFFLEMRKADPNELADVHRAARYIYLNKTSFNGIYRVNKSGAYNVPFGHYKNPPICDEVNLRACARVLRTVKTEIEHMSFERVLDYACAGDFVYMDSPYYPTSKTSSFTTYTAGGFSKEQHTAVRDVAAELKRRKAHVLLSNADVPEVRALYEEGDAGFELEVVTNTRSVAANGKKRGNVLELLIH